jgi:pimeloyl-ACP methyl ester carboxylesterase
MAAATARGDIPTDGQVLGSMARKRRAVFDSRGVAQRHLASKPPFSRFDPQVVSLYVQHGLVEQQQQQRQQHPQQQQDPQQQQQSPGGGEGGPVQLVCAPQQEAAYFDALQPPPSVQPGSIHCPVMLAVAAPGAAGPAAADLASHEHVQAWFYSQTKERQLHGSLRVLNIELAAALAPTARLAEVPGVSHFGPLERPQALAELCTRFFQEAVGGGLQSRL